MNLCTPEADLTYLLVLDKLRAVKISHLP